MTKLFVALVFVAIGLTTGFAQDAEQDEATAASLYNSGLALLKEKKYSEGYDAMIASLEKATTDENEKVVKLAKKNGAVAAYSAGNAKLKEKDYEGAMTYYTSGIELNPAYSSNYIGKGKVANAQGDKLGAIDAYMMAADVAQEAGQEKKVTEAFKRSKQIVGKLFSAKKYAEAIEAGNKVTAKKPMADILYYVSRCQIETGDNEGALASANQAIEVGTADGSFDDKFYVAKGLALEGLNKKGEAIEAYKMVKGGDYLEQAEYKIQKLSGK